MAAAHLNPETPAEIYVHWRDLSTRLGLMDEAAACCGRGFYYFLGGSNHRFSC